MGDTRAAAREWGRPVPHAVGGAGWTHAHGGTWKHMEERAGQQGAVFNPHLRTHLSVIQRHPHHWTANELRIVFIPWFNAQVVDLWTRLEGVRGVSASCTHTLVQCTDC